MMETIAAAAPLVERLQSIEEERDKHLRLGGSAVAAHEEGFSRSLAIWKGPLFPRDEQEIADPVPGLRP